jgi:zinc transport system substrate-binding protein
MKKIALSLFTIITLIILAACTPSKKADIVTTMFPQYDFARHIVGDKMSVSLLIPPGAEVHSYEVTSRDLVAIQSSKLFIFTSLDIDQWIKDPASIAGPDTVVMNLSEHYHPTEHDHDHELSSSALEDDDHDHDIYLHYWVDPLIAIQLIDAILDQIIAIDPQHETEYRANALAYQTSIDELHASFDAYMQDGHLDKTIYFAGHNALSLFGERYHLNIVSLFEGFKPDADLTSSELILFANQVRQANTNILYIEELVQPKAALQIQSELLRSNYQLTLKVLHGYHNITKQEMEDRVTYSDLFSNNIEAIMWALNQS